MFDATGLLCCGRFAVVLGLERPLNGRAARSMSICSRASSSMHEVSGNLSSSDEEEHEAVADDDVLPDPCAPLPAPQGDDQPEVTAAQQKLLVEYAKVDGQHLASQEFLAWAQATGAMQPLIDALHQVCHVVFGLRPADRKAEGLAIQARWNHDSITGVRNRVNSTCYLVTVSWWVTWKAYVRLPLKTTDHLATGDPPGPLQTQPLQRQPGFFETKQVYSRWGPRLRRGLVRGRDYIVLSDHVWSVLHHWYGGSPAICRPIIEFSENRVGPELYPISLRVLRHSSTPATRSAFGLFQQSDKSSPQVGVFAGLS